LNIIHNFEGLRWVHTATSKRIRRRLLWGTFIILISVWVFKWPGRPIIEEVKGDFDCVANLAARKFPAGEAGNIAWLRIQTAAK
jgi:hypothetical protein